MLKLTKKEYEVDEKVVYENEKGERLYEFNIQLTMNELNKVKSLIFDENLQEKVKKLNELESKGKLDELEELNKELKDESQKTLEEFEDIVYKEHKLPFKEIAGEDYFNAMTEEIYSFFTIKLLDKRLEIANTMNTHLHKAGMK